MIKIAISGILGKMGQILKESVLKNEQFKLVGGFDRIKSDGVVTNLFDLDIPDVLIDFSSPFILKDLLEYAKQNKVKLVLATTGYTKADFELIDQYKKDVAIFYSSNYSVGIYLLTKALALVSSQIDSSYDIEMIDIHHRFKKDAPSGTAYKLYDAINQNLTEKRDLIIGQSNEKGIHVHALRLGNYVGEHQVLFSTLSETLTLTHIAHEKSVFAEGALKATQYISTKGNGLFTMDDLMGGKHV